MSLEILCLCQRSSRLRAQVFGGGRTDENEVAAMERFLRQMQLEGLCLQLPAAPVERENALWWKIVLNCFQTHFCEHSLCEKHFSSP